MAKVSAGVGPKFPQVVVLFGATGDLARRKLLPGLFHLSNAGFIPGCRIIAVALDDIHVDDFRRTAREALDEFSSRKVTGAGMGQVRGQPRLRAVGGGRGRAESGCPERREKLRRRMPTSALFERSAERGACPRWAC